MAQIGSFGSIVFEVSDDYIRTFDDYSRKASARLAVHDIIGQKPAVEFLGPGLGELSFTVSLYAFYGVNPKDEADALRDMCESGETAYFIVNGAPVSENKWVIESVAENTKRYDGKGNIIVSTVSLTLKEYVERPILPTGEAGEADEGEAQASGSDGKSAEN